MKETQPKNDLSLKKNAGTESWMLRNDQRLYEMLNKEFRQLQNKCLPDGSYKNENFQMQNQCLDKELIWKLRLRSKNSSKSKKRKREK